MRFFVGIHQPCDAHRVDAAFISVNRLWKRKSPFAVGEWIMDSAGFSIIDTHGRYPAPPEIYGAEIRRWSRNGNMIAAVSQDYMCEPHMLEKTGMTVLQHQQLTIERYDALMACDLGGAYLMPVLQGYAPDDYARHLDMYGARLAVGAWVGVGSVCKRNGTPVAIENVLVAIKRNRPDLLLHGFGVKKTALESGLIRALLHTADSMAWSYAARREGRDANSIEEAIQFAARIETMPYQHSLLTVLAA